MKRRVTQPSVPLALKLPHLLSVEEVAAAIRRHPEVVRRQARSGRLPAEKIGRVWFFRPERLAEAGFTQFLPTMTPSEAPATPATDSPTESLVRALGEAGLEALRRPEQDAIFEVVGRRLADAGFSTFVFLLADGKGLRCAFRRVTEPDTDFEKVAGQPAVGTIIPFDRAPVLQGVCTSLRPHYIADADELVGRMAVAIPTVAANARRVSELLHMSTMIAAPLVVGDRAIGAIVVVGPRLRQADLPAVMAFANQTAAALEAARLLDESRKTEEAAVLALAGAIELRDALHSRAGEHAELAERFAEHLGLDPTRRRRVRYAALLQDLGKLSLPDSIIKKRGRLDSEERALMMTHPGVAADLLGRFAPLADLAPLVRAHHEWFNGEGYPDGLKGEAISAETRIISIVNAFFNVTYDLPIKTETTVDEGLQELTRFAGINLDPALTESFTAMCREAASSKAPWYQRMLDSLMRSQPPSVPAGPRDILSVADSRELRIIYRIAQETNAVLDLDTLLTRIVNIIRDVMGYYMVSILLPGNKADELRVGAHSGYSIDITGLTIPTAQGITGWVFTHGVPQIIADVKTDGVAHLELAKVVGAGLHDLLRPGKIFLGEVETRRCATAGVGSGQGSWAATSKEVRDHDRLVERILQRSLRAPPPGSGDSLGRFGDPPHFWLPIWGLGGPVARARSLRSSRGDEGLSGRRPDGAEIARHPAKFWPPPVARTPGPATRSTRSNK